MDKYGLSTMQIDDIMKDVPGFLGCVAHNQLADLPAMKPGNSVIFNLEDSNQGGSHWVGAYCGNHYLEYFDSFGIPPDDRALAYFRKSKKQIEYNNSKIQGNKSNRCGLYAIGFIKGRVNGLTDYQSVYGYTLDPSPSNERLCAQLAEEPVK